MKRFIPILILTVSLLLAACSPPQKDPPPTQVPSNTSTPIPSSTTVSASEANADLSRTGSHGAVTVKITPLNLGQPVDTLKFDVVMDTHSVDLGMDLTTLATLTTDTRLAIQAEKWDAPSGGHHVEGTLSFPASKDGKSIFDGAKMLTITIINIDNVSREYTWDLSAK